MTKREIIKSLIKDKVCPERMGLYEHFWEDTPGSWENEGLPKGTDLTEYFDYDIRRIPESWFSTDAIPNFEEVIQEDAETKVILNGWGAKMRYWKGKSGTPEHIGFDLDSVDKWNNKYREHLLTLDISRFGDMNKLKASFNKAMSEDRFVTYNAMIIFEIMRRSMGDVTMLESMYIDPDWIKDFCAVVTDNLIMHIEYLFKEVGVPDGIWFYEDMGYTNAPFISPKFYEEQIFPHHQRLFDFIHQYNIPVIMHSCGKIRPYLPFIQKAGVDCLQVLEAKAGQNVIEFAECVNNKMAFMGNLNIVPFETNDYKLISDEILPKLEGVKKNKIPYVFHSDHSIPRSVKLETYKYVLDLYHKNKMY
jgi:uroporphyrinogen decarboxylase